MCGILWFVVLGCFFAAGGEYLSRDLLLFLSFEKFVLASLVLASFSLWLVGCSFLGCGICGVVLVLTLPGLWGTWVWI